MSIQEQTVLDDRYVLDDLIGRGGMADVYRATDRILLRSVAVKVLRAVSDPGQRDRFVNEARMLAALNHPGLVTLLDAGITADRPYLVMELAEGRTLSQRIQEGPIPPEDVRLIGRQLADGLAYAHAQGVVHRDVKPSNVLLVEDRALLVDFGIARLIGSAEHQTRPGDAIGSPAYLSPEQVSGEDLTAEADIFSLGLVLLEALTGLRAYTGSVVEVAVARLNTAPAIPDSLDPGWRALIARMTHRDPGSRPSAAEVANELDVTRSASSSAPAPEPADALVATSELAVTMEAPMVPDTAGLEPPPERIARRRRSKLLAAAFVVVAAAVVGVVILVSQQSDQTNGDDPGPGPGPTVPAGVPAHLRQPLTDLHQAVEGARG